MALYGEDPRAAGVGGLIDQAPPGAGSAAGCGPSVHVLPVVLMLTGGGPTRVDLPARLAMTGRSLLHLNENAGQPRRRRLAAAHLRESKALGWRSAQGTTAAFRAGLRAKAGLQLVNRGAVRRLARTGERTGYTLAIEATQIGADMRDAGIT